MKPEAPSSLEEGVGGGVSKDTLRSRARSMRNNPTEPEKRLWHALKSRQLDGMKFRRQASIGNRILDFYCPSQKLAIEVDGQTHDREQDLQRDAWFERKYEIRTLRFTNEDVMRNMDGVLQAIAVDAGAMNHSQTPSLTKEGE